MVQSPLRVGGLASGIDTTGLIEQLLAVRRRPIQILETRKTDEERRKSALGDVQARLSNFLAQAKALANPDTLRARKTTILTPSGELPQVSVSAGASAAAGSLTVRAIALATATTRTANAAVGQAVATNTALASAGFGTTVTQGTFSVNGATITIDSNTVLSDGVNSVGANTIVARIRDATASAVTVSIANDADGRPNKLQLTSASAIQLGSGADTSNFLTAAKLLASPGTTTRTSTGNMGVTQPGQVLNSARLNTAPSATGTLRINGVDITYNSSVDTLNAVLSRINASLAGVTAAYDANTDKVILTAKSTGSASITVSDQIGNLGTALGLVGGGGTETLGQNAQYSIDGGATQYSASNTIANALPGVAVTLLKTSATAVTVQIDADINAAVASVNGLVAQFNSALSFLRAQTGEDATGKANPLKGDSGINQIANTLRGYVTGPALGLTGSSFTTFSEIGITFGAFVAGAGQSNLLAVDDTKLRAALASNPERVVEVFAGFDTSATLEAGGTGSILSISGKPTAMSKPGRWSIVDNGAGNLTATFTPGDGAPATTATGTITAGGTNTTLIAGLTITAKATLQAGTDTITGAVPKQGIAKRLEYFIDPLTRSSGVLESRGAESAKAITDLKAQISRMEDRIAQEEERLVAKFTAMELTLARLNQQQAVLLGAIKQFEALRS